MPLEETIAGYRTVERDILERLDSTGHFLADADLPQAIAENETYRRQLGKQLEAVQHRLHALRQEQGLRQELDDEMDGWVRRLRRLPYATTGELGVLVAGGKL